MALRPRPRARPRSAQRFQALGHPFGGELGKPNRGRVPPISLPLLLHLARRSPRLRTRGLEMRETTSGFLAVGPGARFKCRLQNVKPLKCRLQIADCVSRRGDEAGLKFELVS